MTNDEFYKFLGAPPTLPPGTSTAVRLDHVWQFAAVLQACADTGSAVALTVANPRLAADYAAQEAVYEALDAPNPLHAAMAAASNDAARLATIAAANASERAEYADDLALGEYDQDALCSQYTTLILGE